MKFNPDQKGAETFPLVVLFGVILAGMMAFIFITIYTQQQDLRVDEQAKAIADDLAQTAFAALSGGQPMFDLPRDAGGSPYKIDLQENSVFVVEITGGRRSGKTYSSVVNAVVAVENQDFSPGGLVYFMRSGDTIIMSAEPIVAPIENIAPIPTGEPPEFYYFAKNNPREATAIGAAYFDAIERYSGEVDVSSYRWERADSLLAQVTSGGAPLNVLRVTGAENGTDVGQVNTAWVVGQVENAEDIGSATACSSPDNAYHSGWLYSPQDALDHLRSRTWRVAGDGAVVVVPADASIQAASATTNLSVYPTWRVAFESYVIFYRMVPWWELENTAGFVFQSDPELEPVV